jgi:hypothetical protein
MYATSSAEGPGKLLTFQIPEALTPSTNPPDQELFWLISFLKIYKKKFRKSLQNVTFLIKTIKSFYGKRK